MNRCGGGGGSISSPLAAAAMLFLLLVGFSHCAAAARLLPSSTAVPAPQLVHQDENGAKAAAGLALQENINGANGDELSSVSEMMGAEAEEESVAACEEGNDECLQRRLLRDAHLDYIYTQHRGKP